MAPASSFPPPPSLTPPSLTAADEAILSSSFSASFPIYRLLPLTNTRPLTQPTQEPSSVAERDGFGESRHCTAKKNGGSGKSWVVGERLVPIQTATLSPLHFPVCHPVCTPKKPESFPASTLRSPTETRRDWSSENDAGRPWKEALRELG